MSSSGLKPHTGASCASADCTSTRMSPVCTGSGNGSAGGRPGSNSSSTSRPQTWPKRHPADEVLDVDAAVAQRAALLVGFGDLGLERDDALEPGQEVGRTSVSSRDGGGGGCAAAWWCPESSLVAGFLHCRGDGPHGAMLKPETDYDGDAFSEDLSAGPRRRSSGSSSAPSSGAVSVRAPCPAGAVLRDEPVCRARSRSRPRRVVVERLLSSRAPGSGRSRCTAPSCRGCGSRAARSSSSTCGGHAARRRGSSTASWWRRLRRGDADEGVVRGVPARVAGLHQGAPSRTWT